MTRERTPITADDRRRIHAVCVASGILRKLGERPIAPCVHRGPRLETIPAKWLDCRCGRVDLYGCNLFSESVTRLSIAPAGAEQLRQLDEDGARGRPRYKGRTCQGCDQGRFTPAPLAAKGSRFRLVFASPLFTYAGVESWWTDLCSGFRQINAPVEPILWLPSQAITDGPTLRRLQAAGCGVAFGPCAPLRDADAAIVWSLTDRPVWLEEFPGRIIGISHGVVDWWMRQASSWVYEWTAVAPCAAPCCPGPATVLLNGVDTDRIQPTMTREQARLSLGLRPGDVGVGIIARLDPAKQHGTAVALWGRMPKAYRLVLVGAGEREKSLRDAAKHLGDRVVFAGLRRDVGNVYAGLDATLSLSSKEGFGLAIVESLLSGLPTTAMTAGIVPELPGLLGCHPVEIPRDHRDVPEAILRAKAPACDLEPLTARAMAARWAAYLLG